MKEYKYGILIEDKEEGGFLRVHIWAKNIDDALNRLSRVLFGVNGQYAYISYAPDLDDHGHPICRECTYMNLFVAGVNAAVSNARRRGCSTGDLLIAYIPIFTDASPEVDEVERRTDLAVLNIEKIDDRVARAVDGGAFHEVMKIGATVYRVTGVIRERGKS